MPERHVRRTGRPPLDALHPTVQVTFRLPAPKYDELYHRARRDRMSIADVVRRAVAADAHDDDADE